MLPSLLEGHPVRAQAPVPCGAQERLLAVVPRGPWPQPQAGSAAGRCLRDCPAAPRRARAEQEPRALAGQCPPRLEAAVGTRPEGALPEATEEAPSRSAAAAGRAEGLGLHWLHQVRCSHHCTRNPELPVGREQRGDILKYCLLKKKNIVCCLEGAQQPCKVPPASASPGGGCSPRPPRAAGAGEEGAAAVGPELPPAATSALGPSARSRPVPHHGRGHRLRSAASTRRGGHGGFASWHLCEGTLAGAVPEDAAKLEPGRRVRIS